MLCTLFVFTGCKEIMSHFDNPVSSNLKVIGEAPVIGVGETYTIEKDKDYTTISDASPAFAVDAASKGIVEVDKNTGVVKALNSGDAKINISLPDNGIYLDAVVSKTIKVRVQNGEQFTKECANKIGDPEITEITILLGENANIDLISDDASNSPFKFAVNTQILGVEGKPATFNVNTKKPPFDIQGGFVVKNVMFNINSTGNVNFLQVRTPTTAKLLKDNGTESNYVAFNPILLENVAVYKQNSCLLKGQGNVRFDNIELRNCLINMKENCNAGIFNFDNGYPEKMVVKKSTIWSTGEGHKGYFITASGKPADVTSASTATFTVDSCTMYKIAVAKNANNGNNLKQKPVLYVNLTNSILVDFGSVSDNNEVKGWLFGGNANSITNPHRTYLNNSYFTSGGSVVPGWTMSTKAGYDDTNTSLTTNPDFKDAENGDFTVSGADQKSKQTGDPRWLK